MVWGWFGRGRGGSAGPWPGRGPFSYLPPWQRPGWFGGGRGRGGCWRLFASYGWNQLGFPLYSSDVGYGAYPPIQAPIPTAAIPPVVPFPSTGAPIMREQERRILEQQIEAIESQLDATRKRLGEIRGSPSTQQPQQAQPHPPTPYAPIPPREELASLQGLKEGIEETVKSVEAEIERLKRLVEQKKAST